MSTKDADSESGNDGQYECQTCGRMFDSWQGRNSHRGHAHDPRVEIECDWCGDTETRAPSHVNDDGANFCCEEHTNAWRSEHIRGENHPNWKENVSVTCQQCGKEESVSPSRAERYTFCGNKCYGAWMSENRVGENHPRWVSGYRSENAPQRTQEVECAMCGKPIRRSPGRIARNDHHFCGRSCYAAWLSENVHGADHPSFKRVREECHTCGKTIMRTPHTLEWGERVFCSSGCELEWRRAYYSGTNNPNWEGGLLHYGEGWSDEKKRSVRERDGFQCSICGESQKAHLENRGQKLHVHHITPARLFDSDEQRNDESNLIALCRPCHKKAERAAPLLPQTAGD
jgi:endogenous inhibitor of DNA gyrase (YacG/DUF329 family)